MQCSECGFLFEGLAAQCPRCEAPLALDDPRPAASHAGRAPDVPGTGWQPGRRPRGHQIALAVTGGLLVGALVLVAFGWAAMALYFCLDLDFGEPDGVDECAEENAASLRLMVLGSLAAIAATCLVTWLLLRLFRRRNARSTAAQASVTTRSAPFSMRSARPPRTR